MRSDPAPGPARLAARPRSRSMLWLVVGANAAVLLVALALVASTPFTISWPADAADGVILGAAVGTTVLVQTFLIHRVLSPLGELWHHMQNVDPLQPGQRISVRARSVEVADLVDAFNDMLDRLERERRDSARRAQAAQDAERRWLALELHDQIGQDLTAVMLGIEASRRLDEPKRTAALEAALLTTEECLERVRSIVDRLRPAALDELGLVSALVDLCNRMGSASGIRLVRRFAHQLPTLSRDAQLVVYRVAQESLSNAVRHAEARLIEVALVPRNGGLRLSVSDDGVGLPRRPDARGRGIRGMRERALLIGARLSVESTTPHGTRVTLDVPEVEAVAPADGG